MRVIQPQQLVFIKNNYQIGKRTNLGISVIAGCYLSHPDHFLTGAQIWDAWKKAPLSLPVLDTAEPKAFAEYIIAGHAGIGRPVQKLTVNAKIGSLYRSWYIEGERKDGQIQPFLNMPLDHPLAWGGKGMEENPLGRGYNNDLLPQIMNINDNNQAPVYNSLAAPTPVPYEFLSRKKYLDQVTDQILKDDYLETIFPGLPPDIDRRYFQMASKDQWFSETEWPEEIPFEFYGFGSQENIIKGTLPAVQARAFINRYKNDNHLEEVKLERKTLWFLPDNNLALISFTGHIPLEHFLEDTIDSIVIGLDSCSSIRSKEHFLQIKNKRVNKDACPFVHLFDPDLMPEDMGLNVIRSSADSPDSLSYDARPIPIEESKKFYNKIIDDINTYNSNIGNINLDDINSSVNYPSTTSNLNEKDFLNNENKKIEGKIIRKIKINANIVDKFYSQCFFIDCDFSDILFENCIFENCVFEKVIFNKTQFSKIQLNDSTFYYSNLEKTIFDEIIFKSVNFDNSNINNSNVNNSNFENCKIIKSNLDNCLFNVCIIKNVMFNKSHMENVKFSYGILDFCIFKDCFSTQLNNYNMKLNKNSIIGGFWENSSFDYCSISSLTVGMNAKFDNTKFVDSDLKKLGFQNISMKKSSFLFSKFEESNFGKSDLSSLTASNCDMSGVSFTSSKLTLSLFTDVSLQQGMLYNSDLCDTQFNGCNFVLANLAMTEQNIGTKFNDCLLERTCWVPRKKQLKSISYENE